MIPPQTSDPDKKASDVLFDSDDGEGHNNAANQKWAMEFNINAKLSSAVMHPFPVIHAN